MFEVTRRQHIKDKIMLRDGGKTEVLEYTIDPYRAAHDYQIAQQVLVQAQAEAKKDASEVNLNKFGEAVVSLFTVLFGQNVAEKLLAFYDGREAEMLEDMFPLIVEGIVPKLREASKEYAARIVKMRA